MDTPLVLLPGMGADERMFAPQRSTFPDLRVPRWIPAKRDETLADYAGRLANAIDLREQCFLGGVSFGGAVALELARYVKPRAVFLIGSLRSPAELAPFVRSVRPFATSIPSFLFRMARPAAATFTRCLGRDFSDVTKSLLQQVSDADAEFLRWAVEVILSWRPIAEPINCPIFQIHGERDRLLPAKLANADVIVPGAGHLVSMTHAVDVNSFLADRMSSVILPTS